MKNLLRQRAALLLVPLTTALGGCFALHEARVESDYSYSANFRRYRTFDFIKSQGLAADTSRLGKVLREAIQTRLGQQGYWPANRRPDLLVNFQLYEGTVTMRGYDQPTLESWVKEAEPESDDTPEQFRRGYDPKRLLLTDGTLQLTLVDARTQRAIWNGYASGVSVMHGALGEIVLRRSVRSILDQYRVFTEGFLADPNSPAGEAPGN